MGEDPNIREMLGLRVAVLSDPDDTLGRLVGSSMGTSFFGLLRSLAMKPLIPAEVGGDGAFEDIDCWRSKSVLLPAGTLIILGWLSFAGSYWATCAPAEAGSGVQGTTSSPLGVGLVRRVPRRAFLNRRLSFDGALSAAPLFITPKADGLPTGGDMGSGIVSTLTLDDGRSLGLPIC